MSAEELAPLGGSSGSDSDEEPMCDMRLWVGWRGSDACRDGWRALCNCVFTAELGAGMYLSPSPTVQVMLGILIAKQTVETWGQYTPTWVAPNSVFVFVLMYVCILPSMVYVVATCRQQDVVFAHRDLVAMLLYLGGSCYSLAYELHRFRWKKQPENAGQLHTEQLAALSIHPNYFGDLFTFTGFGLAVGNRCGLSLAPSMVFTFDFLIIPNSDRYLAQRYAGFGAYAARTEVLVPFLPRPCLHVLALVGLGLSCYLGSFCDQCS